MVSVFNMQIVRCLVRLFKMKLSCWKFKPALIYKVGSKCDIGTGRWQIWWWTLWRPGNYDTTFVYIHRTMGPLKSKFDQSKFVSHMFVEDMMIWKYGEDMTMVMAVTMTMTAHLSHRWYKWGRCAGRRGRQSTCSSKTPSTLSSLTTVLMQETPFGGSFTLPSPQPLLFSQ